MTLSTLEVDPGVRLHVQDVGPADAAALDVTTVLDLLDLTASWARLPGRNRPAKSGRFLPRRSGRAALSAITYVAMSLVPARRLTGEGQPEED